MKKLLIIIAILAAASAPSPAAAYRSAAIVYGGAASEPEINAAKDLAADILHACGFEPRVVAEKDFKDIIPGEATFFTGTFASSASIRKFAADGAIAASESAPAPEAFLIRSFPDKGLVIIAGGDARGATYGIYEFSRRALGIDPFEFWTGRTPPPRNSLEIPLLDFAEQPPVFKLRGYFDNDSDMLANWQGKKLVIEFETWKEMIDSLARLRYNFIDLFDTMGRAEFWNWPYYKKIDPGYKADLALIDKIIDYAHSKGMLAQMPVSFGWQFRRMPREKLCLSKYHGEWLAELEYQLKNTPIGKGDIFGYSPRDIWWDRAYKCEEEDKAGIAMGPLHTRFINEAHSLILKHRPGSYMYSNLWSEGQGIFQSGAYKPEKSIYLIWADTGYLQFNGWPDPPPEGYKMGIYVHAGFYLNHVVQDPLVERIAEATREAARRNMTAYYFVNGQSFKNFILNLEACARASWSPEKFDPEAFYVEWAARYFGSAAAPDTIASLKALRRANETAGGYTKITNDTVELLQKLRMSIAPEDDYSKYAAAIPDAEAALGFAQKAQPLVPEQSRLVFEDQILFPAKIYLENLRFAKLAADAADALRASNDKSAAADKRREAKTALKDAKKRLPGQLGILLNLLETGVSWKKWEGWYKVENFRKITPPPSAEELNAILRTLN